LKPVGTIQRETTLAFGQGNDTPGGAPPAADLRHPVNLIDENELGRASADVEDESRTIPGLQELMTAEHGETRFFLRIDDVENNPRLPPDTLDESFPILSAAARLGRHRANQGHIAATELVSADREGAYSPVHRFGGQPSSARKPLAQPNNAGEGVHDSEAAIDRARDKKPAIVGAE